MRNSLHKKSESRIFTKKIGGIHCMNSQEVEFLQNKSDFAIFNET